MTHFVAQKSYTGCFRNFRGQTLKEHVIPAFVQIQYDTIKNIYFLNFGVGPTTPCSLVYCNILVFSIQQQIASAASDRLWN